MSDAFDTSGGSGNPFTDLLSNIGTGLSSLANNFFSGSAGSQPIASPVAAANTSSVDESVIDPAAAGQAAITAGQNAPTQTNQRTNQQQNPNQQAQNPVAQILRALAQHNQQRMQGNPYQTGGPQAPANLPAPNAQEAAMQEIPNPGDEFKIPGPEQVAGDLPKPPEQPGPEDPTQIAGGPGAGAAAPPAEAQDPDPEAPSGEGPIMSDVNGGQSVPPLLGQLARIALPMLAGGLLAGFGRRPGHSFVGGRFGHPGGFGGRNYWSYHPHYNDPSFAQRFLTGSLVGLPFGLVGGQQGGQPGQQGGQLGGSPQGPAGGQTWQPSDSQPAGNADATDRTASADDVLAMIRQRESGGVNQPPWNNYDYPHSHASGYYQFEPGTWQMAAQQSGDTEAQKYSEAYLAPQAVQDRMARWLLQRYGPNADISWGASGKDKGRPYPNVDPHSFASNKPDHTKTGGSQGPNPDGNAPKTTQMGSEGVAPVM